MCKILSFLQKYSIIRIPQYGVCRKWDVVTVQAINSMMCKKMLLLDFPEKSRYNSFINADDGVRKNSIACVFYWTKLVKTNRRKRRKKQ